MQTSRARRCVGFTLLETIVCTALIAVLWVGAIQMIATFYRYRLADGITSSLLSQSARVQAEFQYFCTNATSIRIYRSYSDKLVPGVKQTTGSYFEATFTVQSQSSDGTKTNTLIRGLEYDPVHNALLEYYYDDNGQLLGSVTLCMNYVQLQGIGASDSAFGINQNHVPYMEYRLMLPNNTASGKSVTSGLVFDVMAYAKPSYMMN